MINVVSYSDCTGCGACAAICPRNVIAIEEDADGFAYPIVCDGCVQCGKCLSVCGALRVIDLPKQRPRFFAASLRESFELIEVSSGGAFWALASSVIGMGGVVYGACRQQDLTVKHVRAKSLDEALCLRRSKYQQSYVADSYHKAKCDLDSGLPVLFSGVPCQVEALLLYLGKPYQNLYTCGIVCHGVPSSKAFRIYCDETEQQVGARIIDINCRDKSQGWRNNSYAVYFDDGQVGCMSSNIHPFHQCYLKGLISRESCGQCRYAHLKRSADITLADFWGYKGLALGPTAQEKGISLVMCSTIQGLNLFEKSSALLLYEEVDENIAVDSCRHLTHSPLESSQRAAFLSSLDEVGFYQSKRCFIKQKSLVRRLTGKTKQGIRKILKHVKGN